MRDGRRESRVVRQLLVNIQLYFDGFLNLAHIFLRKDVSAAKKPCLADSSQLVRHSLGLLPSKDHYCLAGIKPVRLAGERDHLNSIKEPIRRVVTDDDGWPLLLISPLMEGSKLIHHTSHRLMVYVPESNLSPLHSFLLSPLVSRHFRIG